MVVPGPAEDLLSSRLARCWVARFLAVPGASRPRGPPPNLAHMAVPCQRPPLLLPGPVAPVQGVRAP